MLRQKKRFTTDVIQKVRDFQKNEITEHFVYAALARRTKGKNAAILEKISKEELAHYNYFKKFTEADIEPDRFKIFVYRFVSGIFGLTFTLKMMENGEAEAGISYADVETVLPGISKVIADEIKHEQALIEQIEEDAVRHMGSMVLAINNSIQEITGIVVGLTFALGDAFMVGKTAVISGLAATLAMVASEYLSQKAESGDNHVAKKAALYTGLVYTFVVSAIVCHYFIFMNAYIALGAAIITVIIIVTVFTFYMSVVKNLRYLKALAEVSAITAGVVALSFVIGMAMKLVFG